jgi:hypothetical protein
MLGVGAIVISEMGMKIYLEGINSVTHGIAYHSRDNKTQNHREIGIETLQSAP